MLIHMHAHTCVCTHVCTHTVEHKPDHVFITGLSPAALRPRWARG